LDDEPLWLTFEDVAEIHDEQIRLYGGLAGIKDVNLVHGAIAAPGNLFLYEGQEDVLALAVKLCLALAKNHGFADGNKRTATAAMIEFLLINGYDIVVADEDPEAPTLGRWVEMLVRHDITAEQLRSYLRPFVIRRTA
jgi:death-on-curing protein